MPQGTLKGARKTSGNTSSRRDVNKIETLATGVKPNNSREARAETPATLGTSEMLTAERTTATEGPQETTGK